MPVLKSAAVAPETDSVTRAIAALVLLRADDVDAFPTVIGAIARLQHVGADLFEVHELRDAFMKPASIGPHVEAVTTLAKKLDGMTSLWAEAGLLSLVADKETSPEARAIATAAIEEGWKVAPRRAQILRAALLIGDRSYSDKALAAINDPDPKVVEAARNIVNSWHLDDGPAPIWSLGAILKPEQVVAEIMRHPGEVARGEALFTRLNCGKCHTVNPGEALRGPFLPQVAKTYKREQLAESVLLPNKSIAQGFVTYLFVLDSGKPVTGFVSNEAADEITIRDAEGREIKIAVAEIEERKKQELSIMPEGLVKDLTVDEFGSLISYVESLSALAGQAGEIIDARGFPWPRPPDYNRATGRYRPIPHTSTHWLRWSTPMPFQMVDFRPIQNWLLAAFGLTWLLLAGQVATAELPKPLKILLVTGGCCHDFLTQTELIKEGMEARAHVEVTYVQQGGNTQDAKIPLYENADWANGYDLVIHDECFGAVTDVEWCERILAPHKKGLPGVVLHCGVHSYRNDTDNWHEFVGVTSRKHGKLYPHEVTNRDVDHPIMKNFGAVWNNPLGELYWIESVWPKAHPLAVAKNQENGNDEVCIWTNDYHGTRVFATTLGHHNETVESPVYLEFLTRGALWACDKLNDTYLKPYVADAK